MERLTDPDPAVRALAADELSDYFRAGLGDDAVVARLVDVAINDGEENVREAALHACLDAVSCRDVPLRVFLPLVPVLPDLSTELIGYVLDLLGSTHDPAARPVIESYARHPDASVRATAADALAELAGSGEVGAAGRRVGADWRHADRDHFRR